MEYTCSKYQIVKKENLAKNVYSYTIKAKDAAELAFAGQFAHIKVDGFFLRRPISICEIDKQNGCFRLVFEVRGDGTDALARLNEGELMDVMLPLGNGFTLLDSDKKAVVIGGGIGVPPMLEVAKHYGENATAIVGFRSANAVILADDFACAGAKVNVCTDDGTMGEHGFVTTSFNKLLEGEKPDIVYACGPHAMLKAVATACEKEGIKCEVSLEERMGCGVGACLVCACKAVKDGNEYFAHVCKDGPVFDANAVVL